MTKIAEIFEIPEHVHEGDFVLKLVDGVQHAHQTLREYVVTPQLARCFDQALSLIRGAVESGASKGAYLHGSFGSGKSHFMAVLTLLLEGNPEARSIPELADAVAKSNTWARDRRFLVVPYHMIGAHSMESAIFGQYASHVRRRHPAAPTPGVYRAEALFRDAKRLRAGMGDEAFFAGLGSGGGGRNGWGKVESGWDAAAFEAALRAPPGAEDRKRLVGQLVDAYFESARGMSAGEKEETFVPLDEGLSVMSHHARDLGYDAVILFLDELVLWLASRAADSAFVNREGQKVAKLVEAMSADRPIPLVSFIARQRDLRELVGEHLPGAEQLGFADVLNWWEARFDTITLEDRNLPVVVEKRLLQPRSESARRSLEDAFQRTAAVRQEVMNTLLTREGDREMFRQVYPFSPALVQTLIAISSLLQRHRTALKLMLQLLVEQRETLELGDIVPVGDLYDVTAAGDEPFTQAMRTRFDDAKRLYRRKLLPMLEDQHGVSAEEVQSGQVEAPRLAQRFRSDARLVKTLLLSALADGVEVLHGLTPARLAALNHGTVRSPIPGQEGQMVLARCRQWAGQVGEIKVSDDSANPVISLQIVGVDTEGILENAKGLDNFGNRIQKVRHLLYEDLGIATDGGDLLPPTYELLWRGTRRRCELLFRNVRELSLDSFKAQPGTWRIVIDFPFDRAGYTPKDDRARVQEAEQGGEATDTLVWLPSFLVPQAQEDLGRLSVLDQLLAGNRLNEYGGHLSQSDREQARVLLANQRDQMRQRVKNHLLAAYGISTIDEQAVDRSHDLDEHFYSLNPHFKPQPPVGAGFKACLEHLFRQALDYQFPNHPRFEGEVKRAGLRRVLEVVQRAMQAQDGRVVVDRAQRDEVRRIAVPLRLADMGEDALVLRDDWKDELLRKQARDQAPSLNVRRLRQWLENPERRGMEREVQNLIILTFALQTGRSFHLHGGPVNPQLERLDDELELREQALPAGETWQAALERAGAILGVTGSPLRNAQNVTSLVERVGRVAAEYAEPVERLHRALARRLEAFEIEPRDADRVRTAGASAGLLAAIRGAEGTGVVEALAAAPIETSATAMGLTVKHAGEMLASLDRVEWSVLDHIAALPEPYRTHADAVIGRVREALRRDEHVQGLKGTLEEAQREALALLARAATPEPPEAPGPPEPAPPAPRPPPGRRLLKEDRRTVAATEARSAFEAIESDLAAEPEATLELHWKVYTNG